MRGVTVLAIDDDPDLLDLLRDVLEGDGYDVVTVASGPDALAVLRAGLRPGLILLDWMMPGMGGDEVLQRLRAEPHLADIPVVLVSAARWVTPPDGIRAHVRKPWDMAALLQLVCHWCAVGRPREHLRT